MHEAYLTPVSALSTPQQQSIACDFLEGDASLSHCDTKDLNLRSILNSLGVAPSDVTDAHLYPWTP
jgi:hypothetical protein